MNLQILLATSGFMVLAADPGREMYQRAVTQERAGKMTEAIKLYEQVARDFPSDRSLAAKALVEAAKDYEKLGQDGAAKLYERVAREYPDQREQAQTAHEKLAALRQPPPATMTLHQIIPLVPPVVETSAGAHWNFNSDGQHALYVDSSAGGLVLSDLNGSNKRVIFKNTPKQVGRTFPAPTRFFSHRFCLGRRRRGSDECRDQIRRHGLP